MERIRGDHYYNSSDGWPRIGITNRPKCKCNFEGENVNRVAGRGCRDSRKIKINKKLASSEISISCPRKNDNRQAKWRVIPLLFSNDHSKQRDRGSRKIMHAYVRMCVCVCRNICTYNWNGLPLKNNNKKKGTRRSDAYSLAQDRFKNSIEFETVRNSLSNPYVYIYIYSQALSVILLPTSARPTFLLQIHFILLSPRKC